MTKSLNKVLKFDIPILYKLLCIEYSYYQDIHYNNINISIVKNTLNKCLIMIDKIISNLDKNTYNINQIKKDFDINIAFDRLNNNDFDFVDFFINNFIFDVLELPTY